MTRRHELDAADTGKWNASIHYHQVVLNELPKRGGTALDIGCGEGILTRQLAPHFDRVVGVDTHAESITLAEQLTTADNVRYVVDDFMTMELDQFDLVTSVVAIHQMDVAHALQRMRAATRPGGRVVIVGVSAPSYPRDTPRLAVAAVVNNTKQLLGRRYKHSAPMTWPPPYTDSEMDALVAEYLPGARFKRQWLNRYTVVWENPEPLS